MWIGRRARVRACMHACAATTPHTCACTKSARARSPRRGDSRWERAPVGVLVVGAAARHSTSERERRMFMHGTTTGCHSNPGRQLHACARSRTYTTHTLPSRRRRTRWRVGGTGVRRRGCRRRAADAQRGQDYVRATRGMAIERALPPAGRKVASVDVLAVAAFRASRRALTARIRS